MPTILPFLTPFVGRKHEQALYQQFLTWTVPWILLITGQGGIGKSTLLRHFEDETPHDTVALTLNFAVSSLRLDPLTIIEELLWQLEPYVDRKQMRYMKQFLAHGRAKLAQPTGDLTQKIDLAENASFQGQGMQLHINTAISELRHEIRQQVTQAFYALMLTFSAPQVVFLLDTCEWLGELEGGEIGQWLLNELLPSLQKRLQKKHKRCSVVMASRMKLPLTTIQGSDMYSYTLPFLEESVVSDYLSQLGMEDKDLRQHIYFVTYGHALCVEIIGMLWQQRGNTPWPIADTPELQKQFNERMLLDFIQVRLYQRLSMPFRELTKYSSLLRSFDLPTLEAVYPDILPEKNSVEIFERFISFPYIDECLYGRYACHDLLRVVQTEWIRKQEPMQWQKYHNRALAYFSHMEPYPPDWYFHAITLDEKTGVSLWEQAINDANIRGTRGYFSGLLQVIYDETLTLTIASQASRALWQGRFFYLGSDMEGALNSYEEALKLYREVGSKLGEANVLQACGGVQQFRDDREGALKSYEEALKLFRAVGDRLGEANVLQARGNIAAQQEQYEVALDLLTEACQLYLDIKDSYSHAATLFYRSLVYEGLHNLASAITDMREATTIAQQLNLPQAADLDLRLQQLQARQGA